MKSEEELNGLKEKAEALNVKPDELSKEELKQVAGGAYGRSEIWYCKYCCTVTTQEWNGIGEGWDRDGDKHMCDLWVCVRCECTNYRDINTNRLL